MEGGREGGRERRRGQVGLQRARQREGGRGRVDEVSWGRERKGEGRERSQ